MTGVEHELWIEGYTPDPTMGDATRDRQRVRQVAFDVGATYGTPTLSNAAEVGPVDGVSDPLHHGAEVVMRDPENLESLNPPERKTPP